MTSFKKIKPFEVIHILQNLLSFSETSFFTSSFLFNVFITLLIVGFYNPNFLEILPGVSKPFSLITKSKSIDI